MSINIEANLTLFIFCRSLLILALVSCCCCCCWWYIVTWQKNLPPGPRPALPFIGHILLLEKDLRQKFRKWNRQYGDVFCFYIGNQPTIVLNGFQCIKEAVVKYGEFFSDRSNPMPWISDNNKFRLLHTHGLVFNSGPVWKDQRKVCGDALRALTKGDNFLAQKLMEESHSFLKAIEGYHERPFDITQLTTLSVFNGACAYLLNKRYDYNDKTFTRTVATFDKIFGKLETKEALQRLLPLLKKLPGDLFGCKMVQLETVRLRNSFLLPSIIQQKIDGSSDNSKPNFVTCCLRSANQRKENGLESNFSEENLPRIILELILASTETTASTICWSVLYWLHFPHIQEKCYQEICRNIGTSTMPSLSDRPKLAYIEAYVMEVQRYANVVPCSIPHLTSERVQFRGYTIPRNSIVLLNFESVLHDPRVYGDPENFRPERFISSDGKITKPEEFIPFGIGRRMCLGDSVAKAELFIFLSAMVQQFLFEPLDKENIPPATSEFSLICPPKPYKVKAILRKQVNEKGC